MRRSAAALVAAASVVLSACTAIAPVGRAEFADPDAGVQLFQLPWTAVADECEQNLSPAGFGWVLVSPATESIDRPEWWASYQPVSHRIESRLGTREEFADMTARCSAVGVDVIADAVINHMTGQDAAGTGVAGSPYEHYAYPGLYDEGDFHHCGLTPDDDIADYDSREQVQECELVNLADLDTSSPRVQQRIVAHLDDLLSLGAAGFRIDAAKHIAADDLAAIVGQLPEGTRIISEVIRGGGEPIQPEEYTGFGEVFEFAYSRDLLPQLRAGLLVDPELGAERPSHVPSDSAVVFVDNHDTERGEADITSRDGDLYLMANALMLADDFGTPVVYSGYAFTDRDAGAPIDADGRVVATVCDAAASAPAAPLADGDRTCVHAWAGIRGMVELRRVAGEAPRMPGVAVRDAYGFEREGRAVLAVNPGDEAVTLDVPTSLPDGSYCDVAAAGPRVGVDVACPGDAVVAVSGGSASFDLAPGQTAAVHLLSRLP